MISKFKKIIFTGLFLSTVLSFAIPEPTNNQEDIEELTLQVYKQDPWGFIGKKFYDEPARFVREKYSIGEGLFVGVAITGHGIAASCLVPLLLPVLMEGAPVPITFACAQALSKIVLLSSAALGVYAGLNIIKSNGKSLLTEAHKDSLDKFLANWSVYKEYTPEDLRGFFDALQHLYETDKKDVLDNKSDEVFSFVLQQLCKHDERYRTKVQESKDISKLIYKSRY